MGTPCRCALPPGAYLPTFGGRQLLRARHARHALAAVEERYRAYCVTTSPGVWDTHARTMLGHYLATLRTYLPQARRLRCIAGQTWRASIVYRPCSSKDGICQHHLSVTAARRATTTLYDAALAIYLAFTARCAVTLARPEHIYRVAQGHGNSGPHGTRCAWTGN